MDRLDLLPVGAPPTASLYLQGLVPRSQTAMRRALTRVAGLMARYPTREGKPIGRIDLDRVPWRLLDAGRLAWLRDRLLEASSPATVRQALCATRGVLSVLGVLDAEKRAATLVSKPRKTKRTFQPTGHVRDDAIRALRACGTLPAILALPVEAWRTGATRLVVKGRIVRVPDSLGDYLDAWLAVRGSAPGPLFCGLSARGLRVEPDRALTPRGVLNRVRARDTASRG